MLVKQSRALFYIFLNVPFPHFLGKKETDVIFPDRNSTIIMVYFYTWTTKEHYARATLNYRWLFRE